VAEASPQMVREPFIQARRCSGDLFARTTMPERQGDRVVETATEARAGTKDKPQRNVLIISTILVIVLFAAIWLYYFA
jgi:hypothetical protein